MAKKPTKVEEVEIEALDAYRQSRIKTEMWLGHATRTRRPSSPMVSASRPSR
jgi:hypothetical protein